MKISKNSIISVATAAVLMTGFTGCGSDTNNITEGSTSTTSGTSTQIKTPVGTVTGTVMDTNGNPLAGIEVYILDKKTTTNQGGVYTFTDVPVTNTANSLGLAANATANGAIQVTIKPAGNYLGATVMVTPESQQISSGDPAVLNDGQTNPNTNFIDGYVASAGTAVLPKLEGTVRGVLENGLNGARVADVEVCLDLTANLFTDNNTNTASGDVSYATAAYCDTTDENGVFDIVNVPVDAQLAYNLANWNTVLPNPTVTVEDTTVTNIGELLVTPIVTADTVPPVVASVTEGLNPNSIARMMLVDDARTEFTINFSEPINVDSDGSSLPDIDMTSSVTVYVAGQNVNATAVYNGSSLTITLPTALTDGQLVDVHLLNADFRDMSGNFLALNGAIGYDGASSNVTTLVQLQAFNDLNLNAPAASGLAQQEKDENGADDFPLVQLASNAFNDVMDGTAIIEQLNASNDNGAVGTTTAARLSNLATSINGGVPVTVSPGIPRVTFTPTGAASYLIQVTRATVPVVPANMVLEPTNPGTLLPLGGGVYQYTPVDPTATNPIEFVITGGVILAGDVVNITGQDDLGYAGTAVPLTLVDNVKPTTVLQDSYGIGGNTNGSNTVVQFGDGGENAQNSGVVTPGLPYLAINAGLLDNLDGSGAPVTGVLPAVPNLLLDHELAIFDKKFDHDANPATPLQSLYDLGATNTYDSTAYPMMAKNRTVGVAFSENVSLNGITPATTGVSTALTNWTENNDVAYNSDGSANNVDLINMDVADVIAFANDDSFGVIDYTGISDNAGNVADADTNAKVVVLDQMPPMVTEAYFDGTDVVITFNEDIAITAGDTVRVAGITSAAYTGAGTLWTVAGNVLTIDAGQFPGLTVASFALGDYAETAYGPTAYGHARLRFRNISDLSGNNWLNSSAGVTDPRFAIVETIGSFAAVVDNSGFDALAPNAGNIVWTFNHPVRVGAGELFNSCNLTVAEINGPGDAFLIDTYLEYVDSTNSVTALTPQYTSVAVSLDATCKIMTLTFSSPNPIASGDTIRSVVPNVFTSAIDPTQNETVSAVANN